MESLFSLPLPFQRRLTKMYTDTKNSYDFVKEPVKAAEDPEMIALHRKLRIQKDRLVSWGLEWSDPTQSPDIDESINRAGLAELVGSVMSTIKEILAEAEPLWQASKGPTYEKLPSPSEKAIDRKGALIVWDKSRFQDLVRDLTMSIDTLYDLSRTRQSARKPTPKASESSDSIAPKSTATEERLFESTRMQTPQQIDPTTVIWLSQLKSVQASMLTPAKLPRQIVFMRRPIAPSDSKKFMGQSFPTVPVLLEHAPYDPIYSITGITPSMTRFERLFAALSQNYLASGKTLPGLLHLIGYFEEPEHSRFCLLYALPTQFGPVDIESPRMPSITILSDLLSSPNFEPSLEVRYRLAYNVASSVFDMHSKGVVHGNVMSSNILFFEHEPQNRLDLAQVDMRQSFLASCDLFSDNATDSSDPGSTVPALHRHPLDPRTTRYTRLTLDSKSLDLYSLAMLLLEIGLWTALSDIFPTASAIPEKPVEVLKQLAIRCGSLYAKAVQACWFAPEDELSQKARPDVMHQKVFFKVSKALDTCCAIDDLENTSSEETDDSPPLTDTSVKTSRSGTPQRFMASEKTTPASVGAPVFSRTWSEKSSFGKSTSLTEKSWSGPGIVRVTTPQPKVEKVKAKLRTYPSIAIAQEHLNFWHTGLMPHINYVLRGFYKKYPESVEISLESIGESPSTTKPTILVICTSVTKVRSILKRSLVYDKATFGLKVCRGKVVRSRKHGISASKAEARRSMANPASEDSEHGPENPGHQECPSNGASIGACIEGKHLPPVSFGGLIMVDDKPYGMTVHHMLDDTSDTSDDEDEVFQRSILRSSAHGSVPDLTHSDSSVYSLSGDEEYMYALSDYDSSPETDFSDDDEDNYPDSAFEEEDNEPEPGDIPGIPQGCGEHYRVTQPALDDVPEGFYPDEETRDEDHLVSYELGEVYASSGIRRRTENNVVHEVDWALFEFNSERRPEANHIENGQRYLKRRTKQYPLSVASSKNLGGVDVHCIARTSGLQTGRILPAMCIVKIFGRTTPSTSYQVAGKGNLGVPGDSGAWLVDNEQGDVAGHVLAWSSKKKVAYICPMDVLLRDIGETLQASRINLPGGEDIWTSTSVYGSVSSQLVELPASQKLDINPEITADEISQLLRELKLPPTPEQTDEFSTAPSTRHNSTKKDRGEEDKSFTPPVRLIPTPSTAQKPPLPPPRRGGQSAALGLLRTPNLHGKEDWKETGTLGRETGVVVKELEDQDSDGETDLRSTRSVSTSRL